MSELRYDRLRDRWTAVTPGRAARPDQLGNGSGAALPRSAVSPSDCPFCPGNESRTPPELARTGPGNPGAPGWRARVFPNLYPITDASSVVPAGSAAVAATGTHEVVTFSPDHTHTLAELDDDAAVELFALFADRMGAHKTAGHHYSQVMVNQGRPSGASIEHPHAQIVAIDVVPPGLMGEMARFHAGDCVLCELVEEDGRPGSACWVFGDEVRVWSPWAAAGPFEMLIAPRTHHPGLSDAAVRDGVALAVRDVIARVERVITSPLAYNLVLHVAPHTSNPSDFHLHAHLRPRLTIRGGFEEGTGITVNVVAPEEAAALLRNS